MTYMATPYHMTPCPGGHKFYDFYRPFLGHHYVILSLHLTDPCPGVEQILKINVIFKNPWIRF